MEYITRTVYGSYLQTTQLMNLPFTMKQNSTLNEKFSILSGTAPAATEKPSVKYFAIGNGGHKYIVSNGLSRPEPIQHKATDAALYNHLPFVLRETTNDLTQAQRSRFALRKLETHAGVAYYAYYLRRLDLSSVSPSMEYRIVQNGNTTVSVFIPNSSNLNPTPDTLSVVGTNAVTGDFVSTSAKISLDFTDWDISELLNVAKVLYGDEKFAIISEVAFCSGVDRVVQVQGSSGNISFNESIATQVYSFYNTHIDAAFMNNGVNMLLDVGSTEPLFAIEA